MIKLIIAEIKQIFKKSKIKEKKAIVKDLSSLTFYENFQGINHKFIHLIGVKKYIFKKF